MYVYILYIVCACVCVCIYICIIIIIMLHGRTSDAAPERRLRKTRVSHTWDFLSLVLSVSRTDYPRPTTRRPRSFERAASARSLKLWLYNSITFSHFSEEKNTAVFVGGGGGGGYLPLDGNDRILTYLFYFIFIYFYSSLSGKYPCREDRLAAPSLGPPSGPRRHAVRCDESRRINIGTYTVRLSDKARVAM